MVSTHEMVEYLFNHALRNKTETTFIDHLHEMDRLGQITLINNHDIEMLDDLYHYYKAME